MQAQQTLLVVVSNGGDRLMPGLVLRPFGFTVLECESAQEVQRLLSHKTLAGVLVDVQLKGGSCMEVLRCIRKHPMHSETLVVACTDHAAPEVRTHWLSQGFGGVLLKPFRSMDLLALLIL